MATFQYFFSVTFGQNALWTVDKYHDCSVIFLHTITLFGHQTFSASGLVGKLTSLPVSRHSQGFWQRAATSGQQEGSWHQPLHIKLTTCIGPWLNQSKVQAKMFLEWKHILFHQPFCYFIYCFFRTQNYTFDSIYIKQMLVLDKDWYHSKEQATRFHEWQ